MPKSITTWVINNKSATAWAAKVTMQSYIYNSASITYDSMVYDYDYFGGVRNPTTWTYN